MRVPDIAVVVETAVHLTYITHSSMTTTTVVYTTTRGMTYSSV
jgi:hypothetical protein